jgi:hypothetical protein
VNLATSFLEDQLKPKLQLAHLGAGRVNLAELHAVVPFADS